MKREQLTDIEELLFRQLHPSWVREGRPTRQAFQPTKKDDLMLSVARGHVIDARGAYEHHTTRLGLMSDGSWAVTVEECASHSLPAFAAPLTSPPEPVTDPAHALVDFTGLSIGQREAKATMLARAAEARGRLYPDEDGAPFDEK